MTLQIVTFLIIGIFNILFGFLIKKFELANFLTFYDPKKDKEIRAEIEKLAGDGFSLMGVFMLLVVILGYFTKMDEFYFGITQASIISGFALLMILRSSNLRKNIFKE